MPTRHGVSVQTHSFFARAPVVPVIVVEDVALAVPLARALVEGGLPLLEVTLRTPAALAAIKAMREAVPEAVIGAGSILSSADLESALGAGAQFIVTPGASPALLAALARAPVPCLPGIATASEAIAARDHGFRVVKFFPAEAMGGIKTLSAWQGPLGDIFFCPTGGIDLQRAPSYLALKNVLCVGGSWMVPAPALQARDFAHITSLARDAAGLAKPAG